MQGADIVISQNELEFAIKMLYETYQLPVQYIAADHSSFIQQPEQTEFNPMFPNSKAALTNLIEGVDTLQQPILKITDYMEYFLVINGGELLRNGFVVIGPTLVSDMPEGFLESLFLELQIPGNVRDAMQAYYGQMNWINLDKWNQISKLAAYVLFHKMIDKVELAEQPKLLSSLENSVEKNLHSRRLETDFHLNYRLEQQIWQCVRDGDQDRLTVVANTLQLAGFGLLSTKSHIRNLKNQAIISISLATRAAVDGGLYPEIAYTMSDTFILQVEDTNETNQIYVLMMRYLYNLTDRVHTNKEKSHSRTVSVCQNYIYDYIFERISVHTLAQLVRLHPVYLSQLFKKETGFSLNQYIQREKIREAQKMLIQSDLSATEISALLQFNDQSYFSSIFKKLTGLTPNQYRNNPQASPLK